MTSLELRSYSTTDFDAVKTVWSKGTRGGYMQVFSNKDGHKLAKKKPAYLPAFDGLVAGHGRLYMATRCNSILC